MKNECRCVVYSKKGKKMRKYDTVIGLEVHVELATKTKIFCGCKSEFGGEVNTHVCPVCMGLPGSLPVLNKKVVEHAIALGVATNCSITNKTKFDRKNYFYPDNPQNYQISQLYRPIVTDGYIDIDFNNKRIGIHEMHMEEDAGKIIHDDEKNISLIDYNRAGVPLIEIVTKPDMSSGEEVLEFLDKLKSIIKYIEISDCKLNEGSMRVDVNLSVKEEGSNTLGTRTEMKNLNSFKAIVRAIEHERDRQIDLIEKGEMVIQETRRWDDNVGCSYSMRSKEDVNDYRYFPEPDIKEIYISKEWINTIKQGLPELRADKIKRYKEEYELPEYDIQVITEHKNIAYFYEKMLELLKGKEKWTNKIPKKVSNWLMVDIFKAMNDRCIEPEKLKLDASMIADLILLVEDKKVTKANALEVLEDIFDNKLDKCQSVENYVEEKGLLIVEDMDMLNKVVDEVFANNPKSIEDYKNGKTKAMGFLVGQTMKAMKGKASPESVNSLITKKLESLF